MLLLVVEADLYQRCNVRQLVGRKVVKKLHRRRIDMAAVGSDLFSTRPGEMATLVAGMPGAGTDVIRVEQISVVGMERLVSRPILAKQELLEKPGRMGAVPFRGTGVRHGLDQLIFGGKRGGPAFGLISHRKKSLGQILGEAAGIGE